MRDGGPRVSQIKKLFMEKFNRHGCTGSFNSSIVVLIEKGEVEWPRYGKDGRPVLLFLKSGNLP